MKKIFALGILMVSCNFPPNFKGKTWNMKRPIILVAKNCGNYNGSMYCSVILRDSVGDMETLNSDQFANAIANSYNVGDTLK